MSKKIGYIRISSSSQNLNRQIDEMVSLGIEKENIYEDVVSGSIKGEERVGYNYMKRCLRAGDVLYISSIDRLGRDYEDIISEWKDITINKKADIKVLDMPLLDTTKNKDLLGNLIGSNGNLSSSPSRQVHGTSHNSISQMMEQADVMILNISPQFTLLL